MSKARTRKPAWARAGIWKTKKFKGKAVWSHQSLADAPCLYPLLPLSCKWLHLKCHTSLVSVIPRELEGAHLIGLPWTVVGFVYCIETHRAEHLVRQSLCISMFITKIFQEEVQHVLKSLLLICAGVWRTSIAPRYFLGPRYSPALLRSHGHNLEMIHPHHLRLPHTI